MTRRGQLTWTSSLSGEEKQSREAPATTDFWPLTQNKCHPTLSSVSAQPCLLCHTQLSSCPARSHEGAERNPEGSAYLQLQPRQAQLSSSEPNRLIYTGGVEMDLFPGYSVQRLGEDPGRGTMGIQAWPRWIKARTMFLWAPSRKPQWQMSSVQKWAGVELHIYPSSLELGPQSQDWLSCDNLKPAVLALGRKPLVMHL